MILTTMRITDPDRINATVLATQSNDRASRLICGTDPPLKLTEVHGMTGGGRKGVYS